MSVTVDLLKPIKDLKRYADGDNIKYSGGLEHEEIYIQPHFKTHGRGLKKHRNRRISKYEKKIQELFPDSLILTNEVYLKKSDNFNSFDKRYSMYVIPVKNLAYGQGWMLNRDFFKKTETTFFAFTKEEMLKLIDRYFIQGDPKTKAIRRMFCEAWDESGDENLIFRVAW